MVLHARDARRPWLFAMVPVLVALVGACNASVGASAYTGGSGEPDAMIPEAGRDAHPLFAPDASGCRPGDVDSYSPGPYHFASAAWQGACRTNSSGQDPIMGYYAACLGGQATSSACDSFLMDPANARCAKCIVTNDTATNYGPLIEHDQTFLTTNVAGCLELTDSMAISCAKALQTLTGCELYACEANCPIRDQATRMAYDACASEADRFGCASYARSAACLASQPDAGQVGKCLAPKFYDFYLNVVPLFCGSPPSGLEGGSLPSFDASIDVVSGASADAAGDAHPSDARPPVDAKADAAFDAPRD